MSEAVDVKTLVINEKEVSARRGQTILQVARENDIDVPTLCHLDQARWFYALILVSTAAGVGLDFIGVNPVKALYWTAVINGLLAPFLLVAILVVAGDKKLMQGQPSSRLGWIVVAIATIAMFAAGIVVRRSPHRHPQS
jgi:hypothetical protein